MSRIGKIARLPRAVREELNCRLLDGEQQSRLVEWLNGREEVQAVLTAEFSGQPINEPNLTAWVQGGFEDWRRQQEAQDAADRLVEETAAVADAIARQETGVGGQATGAGCLVDRVATMAALAMAEQLMAIRRMEDGTEKRRAVLKIVRGLVRLRKSERDCERGLREAAQAQRSREIHEHWAEGARRRGQTTGLNGHEHSPSPSLRRAGEDGDVRTKMTEIVARMSDEQIAESLRRSGYMRADHEPKPVSWTDEDEAAYQAEEEAEKRKTETSASTSTIKNTSTLVSQPVAGITSDAGGTSTPIVPPEGGTTDGRQRTEDGGLKTEDGRRRTEGGQAPARQAEARETPPEADKPALQPDQGEP